MTSVSELLPAPFAWIKIPRRRYSIAQFPITNAQYAQFMAADGYSHRNWWINTGWTAKLQGWDEIDGWWKPSEIPWTEPRYWHDEGWNRPNHPVVGVSWHESIAFCLWLSDMSGEKIMLPTEEQWQYAAQGTDNRAFPWGQEWDCTRCNNSVNPCESVTTTPVTAYEGKGVSPLGVVDIVGNVQEWCLTAYDDNTNNLNSDADWRILRGGSWDTTSVNAFRCDSRNMAPPDARAYNAGFRIVRS